MMAFYDNPLLLSLYENPCNKSAVQSGTIGLKGNNTFYQYSPITWHCRHIWNQCVLTPTHSDKCLGIGHCFPLWQQVVVHFHFFFFPLDIRKAGWSEETQEGNPSCLATKGIVCVEVSGELVSELNTPLSFLTLVYTLSSLHKPSM